MQTASETNFGHPSELALAQLLDFYQIVWEYEPTLFPVAWDNAGNATRYFRPDFYLPNFGVYLELTAATASSVLNSKNKNMRLLRKHYPGVAIRLIGRDTLSGITRRYGLRTDAVHRRRIGAPTVNAVS